jgi:hypothetical protein
MTPSMEKFWRRSRKLSSARNRILERNSLQLDEAAKQFHALRAKLMREMQDVWRRYNAAYKRIDDKRAEDARRERGET